jgi:agmatinase
MADNAFTATSATGQPEEMTFAGALSFLRRKYSKDLSGADVAVTGIPFDAATSNRPGARLGPGAIRAASVQLAELKAFPSGIDLYESLNIVDYGDCFLDYGYPEAVVSAVTEHTRGILNSNTMAVSLGGDHFVTYPLLVAHAEKHGPLSLLHFDAHSDTWPDDGKRLDHGSMFTRAVSEGLVVPERSVQVGLRTHNDETLDFNILTAPWVHEHGVKATTRAILDAVGTHGTYLTFDIDCLDPAFAPGTGTPVAGGLSPHQVLTILRSLGSVNFVGMDVVEVAPAYDHAEITAINAATIVHDYLCLIAMR